MHFFKDPLFSIALAAACCAAVSVCLAISLRLVRRLAPWSGLVLILTAVLGVLPEAVEQVGWLRSGAGLAAGLSLLWVIDRYLAPICPTCHTGHDHSFCLLPLHGYAVPLIVAFGLHGFIDGWMISAAKEAGDSVVNAGLAIHKLSEGLILGMVLRASLASRWKAALWAILAQLAILPGGLLERELHAFFSASWTAYLLTAAAALFLYLGGHAVHAGWKRRLTRRSVAASCASPSDSENVSQWTR